MAHVSCEYCGETVNTLNSNAFQEVIGWVNRGRKRGVNQIREEKPTGRWAHSVCIANPTGTTQTELF